MDKKFKDAKTLKEHNAFYILAKKQDEIELISKHQFPRNYNVMKQWAEGVLSNANLPLPKSASHSWFVRLDNGEYIEVSRTHDNLMKHKRTGSLRSYLGKHEKNSIEYEAISLLEEIELIEMYIENNNAKLAAHHSIQATAIYMEALIYMNYSSVTITKIQQVAGTKKQRVKRNHQLYSWLREQDLSLSASALWEKLKNENGSYHGDTLYIDGDMLIQRNDKGEERSIKQKTFENHILKIKKESSLIN